MLDGILAIPELGFFTAVLPVKYLGFLTKTTSFNVCDLIKSQFKVQSKHAQGLMPV